MHVRGLIKVVLFLALCLTVAGGGTPARADGASDDPQQVQVELDLLHINNLDLSKGTFEADFYLTFRCPRSCEDVSFEIYNGQFTKDQQDDSPNRLNYRVKATLTVEPKMHAYPFDSHDLRIEIEDRELDTRKLVYVPALDASGLEEDFWISGWDAVDSRTSEEVVDHFYPAWNAAYSHYIFHVGISRPVLPALLKGLFPAVVLLLSGFLSMVMGPDKGLQRLGVVTSALVATTLYHLSVTSALPPVPYLTWMDKFMVINYGALGLTLLATVALVRLQETGHDELTQQLHRLSAPLLPGLWLLAQASLAMRIEPLHLPPLLAWLPIVLALPAAAWLWYRSGTPLPSPKLLFNRRTHISH